MKQFYGPFFCRKNLRKKKHRSQPRFNAVCTTFSNISQTPADAEVAESDDKTTISNFKTESSIMGFLLLGFICVNTVAATIRLAKTSPSDIGHKQRTHWNCNVKIVNIVNLSWNYSSFQRKLCYQWKSVEFVCWRVETSWVKRFTRKVQSTCSPRAL